jgi:hypothetical protein
MQCPVDGTALVMSDRQGVEIDYCPSCRGVWLDRGELDKIIERASPAPAPAAPAGRSGRGDAAYDDDDRDRGDYRKKRRGSLLGEIFDF